MLRAFSSIGWGKIYSSSYRIGGIALKNRMAFSTSKQAKQKTPYMLLEVSEQASQEEIKSKYYELAQKYHPDSSDQADTEKFKEISQAYTLLKDVAKRRELDEQLKKGMPFSFGANRTTYYSQYHYGDVRINPNQRRRKADTFHDSPYPRPKMGEFFDMGIKFSKGNAQARVQQKQRSLRNFLMIGCTFLALLGVVELIVRVYEFNRGLDKKYSEEMFGKKGSKGEVRLNPNLKRDEYII